MEKKGKFKLKVLPFDREHNKHAIQKSEGGVKRWYLQGISSGAHLDKHNEIITENGIDSFLKQANSRNILLFPDKHGIRFTEDIGILTNGEKTKDNDFFTEYRMYDEYDPVDELSKGRAKKAILQITGQPPYSIPIQYELSIEGDIPPEKLLSYTRNPDGTVGNRKADEVILKGVVLLDKGAYPQPPVMPVYKQLMTIDYGVDKGVITNTLTQAIRKEEFKDAYFRKRWKIQDIFESEVNKIMVSDEFKDKKAALQILFAEFTDLMINLILESQSMFLEDQTQGNENPYGNDSTNNIQNTLSVLNNQFKQIAGLIKS